MLQSNPSLDAFYNAYGRLPDRDEMIRMEALLPADRSNKVNVLRRVMAMFDRATHATPLSGRFSPADLATIDMGDFNMTVDTGDWAGRPGYRPRIL